MIFKLRMDIPELLSQQLPENHYLFSGIAHDLDVSETVMASCHVPHNFVYRRSDLDLELLIKLIKN